MLTTRVESRFAPSAESVGAARQLLEGLGDRLTPEALEDLRLVVSELVTNSIRHAGLGSEGWIRVEVWVSNSLLRGEVSDTSPGFEHLSVHAPSPGELPGGWGLYMVDGLVSRWGIVEANPPRILAHVWFEMEV